MKISTAVFFALVLPMYGGESSPSEPPLTMGFSGATIKNDLTHDIVLTLSDGAGMRSEVQLRAGETIEKMWSGKLRMPIEYTLKKRSAERSDEYQEILSASSGIASYSDRSHLTVQIISELKILTIVRD